MHRCTSRADRLDVYLRAAQAYMLISMPTGTSTIFGVFQLIHSSQGLAIRDLPSRTCSIAWHERRADVEPRATSDPAQGCESDRRARIFLSWARAFLSWSKVGATD